jgi:hypothetical protein
VSALLGAGAAMSATGLSATRAAAGFAAVGLIVAAILGSGRLGADVGAVLTLAAGTAVAAASILPAGRGRRAVAGLAVLVPVLALGALAVLDTATGGDAHLSRSVLDEGTAGLADTFERRLATQERLLASPVGASVSAVALAALLGLIIVRRRLLAPLARAGARPLGAALSGALAAVLAGALANDSAPDMLAIGAVLGLLAAAYVSAGPRRRPETGDARSWNRLLPTRGAADRAGTPGSAAQLRGPKAR